MDNPESLEGGAPATANPPGDRAEEVGVEHTTPHGTTQETSPAPTGVTLSGLAATHQESHPGYDPAVHAANPDGTPKTKADGSLARKRGRKPGQTSPLPAPGQKKAPLTCEATPARISPDEAARQAANLVINGAVWICGEEIGVPKDKAESEGLLFSFKNYFTARGVPDIPPEIGLALGLASYIIPRLREVEKKEGKISRAVNWVKFKIAEFKGQ